MIRIVDASELGGRRGAAAYLLESRVSPKVKERAPGVERLGALLPGDGTREWHKGLEDSPERTRSHAAFGVADDLEWKSPKSFAVGFVPRYVRDLASSEDAASLIERIAADARAGKEIDLAVYGGADDPSKAHARVLAGILSGMGVEVKVDGAPAMAMFHDVYAAAREGREPSLPEGHPYRGEFAKAWRELSGTAPQPAPEDAPASAQRPVSQPAAAQTAPVQPTPARPVPQSNIQPAPQQPAPAQPVPMPTQQPAPAQPAPVQPMPAQAAPAQPVPAQPMPVQSAPVQPMPQQPAPQPNIQPAPVQPMPVQTAPVQPGPVQPAPQAGQPPVQPAPVQPAPQPGTAPAAPSGPFASALVLRSDRSRYAFEEAIRIVWDRAQDEWEAEGRAKGEPPLGAREMRALRDQVVEDAVRNCIRDYGYFAHVPYGNLLAFAEDARPGHEGTRAPEWPAPSDYDHAPGDITAQLNALYRSFSQALVRNMAEKRVAVEPSEVAEAVKEALELVDSGYLPTTSLDPRSRESALACDQGRLRYKVSIAELQNLDIMREKPLGVLFPEATGIGTPNCNLGFMDTSRLYAPQPAAQPAGSPRAGLDPRLCVLNKVSAQGRSVVSVDGGRYSMEEGRTKTKTDKAGKTYTVYMGGHYDNVGGTYCVARHMSTMERFQARGALRNIARAMHPDKLKGYTGLRVQGDYQRSLVVAFEGAAKMLDHLDERGIGYAVELDGFYDDRLVARVEDPKADIVVLDLSDRTVGRTYAQGVASRLVDAKTKDPNKGAKGPLFSNMAEAEIHKTALCLRLGEDVRGVRDVQRAKPDSGGDVSMRHVFSDTVALYSELKNAKGVTKSKNPRAELAAALGAARGAFEALLDVDGLVSAVTSGEEIESTGIATADRVRARWADYLTGRTDGVVKPGADEHEAERALRDARRGIEQGLSAEELKPLVEAVDGLWDGSPLDNLSEAGRAEAVRGLVDGALDWNVGRVGEDGAVEKLNPGVLAALNAEDLGERRVLRERYVSMLQDNGLGSESATGDDVGSHYARDLARFNDLPGHFQTMASMVAENQTGHLLDVLKTVRDACVAHGMSVSPADVAIDERGIVRYRGTVRSGLGKNAETVHVEGTLGSVFNVDRKHLVEDGEGFDFVGAEWPTMDGGTERYDYVPFSTAGISRKLRAGRHREGLAERLVVTDFAQRQLEEISRRVSRDLMFVPEKNEAVSRVGSPSNLNSIYNRYAEKYEHGSIDARAERDEPAIEEAVRRHESSKVKISKTTVKNSGLMETLDDKRSLGIDPCNDLDGCDRTAALGANLTVIGEESVGAFDPVLTQATNDNQGADRYLCANARIGADRRIEKSPGRIMSADGTPSGIRPEAGGHPVIVAGADGAPVTAGWIDPDRRVLWGGDGSYVGELSENGSTAQTAQGISSVVGLHVRSADGTLSLLATGACPCFADGCGPGSTPAGWTLEDWVGLERDGVPVGAWNPKTGQTSWTVADAWTVDEQGRVIDEQGKVVGGVGGLLPVFSGTSVIGWADPATGAISGEQGVLLARRDADLCAVADTSGTYVGYCSLTSHEAWKYDGAGAWVPGHRLCGLAVVTESGIVPVNHGPAVIAPDGSVAGGLEEKAGGIVFHGRDGARGASVDRDEVRCTRDGAMCGTLRREGGELVASVDEEGAIATEDRSAVFEHPFMAPVEKDAMARQCMFVGNMVHREGMSEPAQVAYGFGFGWNMEDAIVVSREFAEKNGYVNEDGEMRALVPGDKLDSHGNKGVICLVVDRNMDPQTAEALGIGDIVEVFRRNKGLDVLMSPASSMSRFNMGSFVEAMNSEMGLLPFENLDGSTTEGGIGYLSFCITDKTAESKTKVYGSGSFEHGKGRKAGAKLASVLMSKGAFKLMDEIYSGNAEGLDRAREVMLAMGCDIDRDLKILSGWSGPEDEGRLSIKIPGASTFVHRSKSTRLGVKSSGTQKVAESELKAILGDALQAERSEIVLPFPLNTWAREQGFGSDLPTIEEDGKTYWRLPVLAKRLREQSTDMDGTPVENRLTRLYTEIYYNAAWYNQAAAGELHNMPNTYRAKNPLQPSRTLVIPKGLNLWTVTESDSKELHDLKEAFCAQRGEAAWRDWCVEQVKGSCQQGAQRALGTIGSWLNQHRVDCKHNIFSDLVMAKRVDMSSTSILSSNPTLDVDVIALSPEVAKGLGVYKKATTGQSPSIVVWRDPLNHDAGIRYMRVVVDDRITGCAMNPVVAKIFEGDFDGDTLGLYAPQDEGAVEQCEELLSVRANLTVDAEAPVRLKDPVTKEEFGEPVYPLFINMGVDMARGMHGHPDIERRLNEIAVEANEIRGKKLENPDLDFSQRERELCREVSSLVHKAFGNCREAKVLSMESPDALLDSLEEQVVKTGAKGNPKKWAETKETMCRYAGWEADENGRLVARPMTLAKMQDHVHMATATAIKTQAVGLAGVFANRLVAHFGNVCPKAALEVGMAPQQALLQAKNNADQAWELFEKVTTMLNDGVMAGRAYFWDPQAGKWKDSGEPVSPEVWAAQLKELVTKDYGLGLDVNPVWFDELAKHVGTEKKEMPDGEVVERVVNFKDPAAAHRPGQSWTALEIVTSGGRLNEAIAAAVNEGRGLLDGPITAHMKPDDPKAVRLDGARSALGGASVPKRARTALYTLRDESLKGMSSGQLDDVRDGIVEDIRLMARDHGTKIVVVEGAGRGQTLVLKAVRAAREQGVDVRARVIVPHAESHLSLNKGGEFSQSVWEGLVADAELATVSKEPVSGTEAAAARRKGQKNAIAGADVVVDVSPRDAKASAVAKAAVKQGKPVVSLDPQAAATYSTGAIVRQMDKRPSFEGVLAFLNPSHECPFTIDMPDGRRCTFTSVSSYVNAFKQLAGGVDENGNFDQGHFNAFMEAGASSPAAAAAGASRILLPELETMSLRLRGTDWGSLEMKLAAQAAEAQFRQNPEMARRLCSVPGDIVYRTQTMAGERGMSISDEGRGLGRGYGAALQGIRDTLAFEAAQAAKDGAQTEAGSAVEAEAVEEAPKTFTVAFTGSRPQHMFGDGPQAAGRWEDLTKGLAAHLERLYEEKGLTDVVLGGAEGVDHVAWLAAEMLNERLEKAGKEPVTLHLYVPYENFRQDDKGFTSWCFGGDAYDDMRAKAEEAGTFLAVSTLTMKRGDKRFARFAYARNDRMIERADQVIAVHRMPLREVGGTHGTVVSAEKKGVPVEHVDAVALADRVAAHEGRKPWGETSEDVTLGNGKEETHYSTAPFAQNTPEGRFQAEAASRASGAGAVEKLKERRRRKPAYQAPMPPEDVYLDNYAQGPVGSDEVPPSFYEEADDVPPMLYDEVADVYGDYGDVPPEYLEEAPAAQTQPAPVPQQPMPVPAPAPAPPVQPQYQQQPAQHQQQAQPAPVPQQPMPVPAPAPAPQPRTAVSVAVEVCKVSDEDRAEMAAQMDKEVSFRGKLHFLSNLYETPTQFFDQNGYPVIAKCSESAFQAMKCSDPNERITIAMSTGAEAKRLGRQVDLAPMGGPEGWNRMSKSCMAAAVEAKFRSDPRLAAMLVQTPGEIVEKNTWGDTEYGTCAGRGRNVLGRMLMAYRKDLSEKIEQGMDFYEALSKATAAGWESFPEPAQQAAVRQPALQQASTPPWEAPQPVPRQPAPHQAAVPAVQPQQQASTPPWEEAPARPAPAPGRVDRGDGYVAQSAPSADAERAAAAGVAYDGADRPRKKAPKPRVATDALLMGMGDSGPGTVEVIQGPGDAPSAQQGLDGGGGQ